MHYTPHTMGGHDPGPHGWLQSVQVVQTYDTVCMAAPMMRHTSPLAGRHRSFPRPHAAVAADRLTPVLCACRCVLLWPSPPNGSRAPVVRCTRLGALALGAPGPAPNAVQDTEALYVEAAVGRVLEVQYGRGTEVFGWHALGEDQGRHNIPMPAPGPWTLQVRFVARGVAGPVGTYSLVVTGEWWARWCRPASTSA
jgi:hypothetical protein